MPIFVTLLLAAALGASAEPAALGSTPFSYMTAAQLRALPAAGIALPRPVALAGLDTPLAEPTKLTDLSLLAQTARRNVFGYTENPTQHGAFLVYWSPILSAAGFKLGQPTWEHTITLLPYDAPDGKVVRQFMADPLQFKPKDEVDRLANWRVAAEATRAAGLPVITSFMVENDLLLPTYAIYYITKYDEKPEHEVQLRVLRREGVDPEVLKRAGLKVVQSTDDFITVYIGKEISMVWRTADKLEDLQPKIEEFKKFLGTVGATFIEAKVVELPPGSYRKYEASLYFFL